MKLRIFGQRIKVNGKAIEKSSKNYIVNGELISTEEEPGPSDAPGAEDDQNSGSPGSSTNPAPTKNPNEEWRLVWSDEFNGSEINMANWSYDDPTNGRWNGEVQSYTQNNAYIKDGALVIEARKEDITEPSGETYHYTSSKLITKGKSHGSTENLK